MKKGLLIVCLFIGAFTFCDNLYAIEWIVREDLPEPMTVAGSIAINGFVYTISKTTSEGPSLNYRYDPETDSWIKMSTPPLADRYGMSSVVYEGKIYLFGGVDHGMPLSNYAIYDPENDTWDTSHHMTKSLQHGTATLINGKVYITGDHDTHFGDLTPGKDLLVFDPEDSSWSTGEDIPTPRDAASAVNLDDKLYLIGGWIVNGTIYSVVEIYDPASDLWESGPQLNVPRMGPLAAVVDDRIYVIGGSNYDGIQDSVEMLNPETNEWEIVGTMITPRGNFADSSNAIIDGEIYVIGGENSDGYSVAVESMKPDSTFNVAFDIKPGLCPNLISMKSRRFIPTAILGTHDFDIENVDPASVKLLGVSPFKSKIKDVATPFEPYTGKEQKDDCNNLRRDGYSDLLLLFKTKEIVDAILAEYGSIEKRQVLVLPVEAQLYDGKTVYGEDVVVVINKRKRPHRPRCEWHKHKNHRGRK